MREYLSVQETGKTIVSEVVQYGVSKSWAGDAEIARELEKYLAKFNVGYVDPKTGSWSHCRNGTRYFTTMKFMSSAKDKIGSIVSAIKNR